MQKLKKPVSVLLTVIMAVSLFTIIPMPASAAEAVEYISTAGGTRTQRQSSKKQEPVPNGSISGNGHPTTSLRAGIILTSLRV